MYYCRDCYETSIRDLCLPQGAKLAEGAHGIKCNKCSKPICAKMLENGQCKKCAKVFFADFFGCNFHAVQYEFFGLRELFCFDCAKEVLSIEEMAAAWRTKGKNYSLYLKGHRRLHGAFCEECYKPLCSPTCPQCSALTFLLRHSKDAQLLATVKREIARLQRERTYIVRPLGNNLYTVFCEEKTKPVTMWQTTIIVEGAERAGLFALELTEDSPITLEDLLERKSVRN